jgi:PAS domain S-box-containing protein
VIIEEDTTISLANTEFESLSGYMREEIEGKKSWTEFVDKDDLERMKEYHHLRRVGLGLAPLVYDFRFIDRRGDLKIIHLDIGLIPDTKKSVGSLLDITELKNTEEALQKSEEKYRSVLDNMVEGCQIIGFNWRYLYVNDAVARHGHFKKDELLGHTMMEMYPGIEDTQLCDVLRCCMKERTSHHFDNKFTYPDGTLGWFELRVHPASEGIFILSIDITERVKRQEEILFKNALLEEKIKKQQEKLGYLEKD